MISQATLMSPRLAALQEELLYGNHTALATFWREITAQGTPLIEPIPGDDIHVLVTFLWQATEEIQNVAVAGALVGWNISENQMSRMLNTDLWYKTYIMRSDTRAIYRFSLNDTLLLTPHCFWG
jgi:hypothetical protein